MSSHILKFIELIRGAQEPGCTDDETARGITKEIFSQGNCGNFALALQMAFGGDLVIAEGHSHVAAAISGRVYDITGDVTAVHKWLPTTESNIRNDCLVDNYSFEFRGPIV